MSNHEIFKDLKVLEVCTENENQKILICKHVDTNIFYLVNIILNKKVLEFVDFEELKRIVPSLEKIVETDDAYYLITKHYNYPILTDYLSNNKPTISQQVNYATYVLEQLVKLRSFPPYIISSLINHNNLYIDENNNIRTLGLIYIYYNYLDINKSNIISELGNILHIIFSGSEIQDNSLSKDIPPDIKRIIENCINNEYLKYDEIFNDFKSSKLYKLINPEVKELNRVYSMRKSLKKRRMGFRIRKNGAILAVIILLLLPFLILNFNRLFLDKDNTELNTSKEQETENNQQTENLNGEDKEQFLDEDKEETIPIESKDEENIHLFFNEEIAKSSGAKNTGVIDNQNYYKGDLAVKVINSEGVKKEFLIGRIDLNKDEFNFLKERNVNVSMQLLGNKNIKGIISLKVFEDNKLLSDISSKVTVRENLWILHNTNLHIGNGEYIDIYISYEDEGTVWIDSYSIEILK